MSSGTQLVFSLYKHLPSRRLFVFYTVNNALVKDFQTLLPTKKINNHLVKTQRKSDSPTLHCMAKLVNDHTLEH